MKLQPIRLINTLNRRDINQLNLTNNEWITKLFSQHDAFLNCTKSVQHPCAYIVDEKHKIVICKSRNSNGIVKTAQGENFLVSIVNKNRLSTKVITYFADTLDKLPKIVQTKLFGFVGKVNKELNVDYQRVATVNGAVDTEDIVLRSPKGAGYIKRNNSNVVAQVVDNDNNTIYMGSAKNFKPSSYEDIKKDIYNLLV